MHDRLGTRIRAQREETSGSTTVRFCCAGWLFDNAHLRVSGFY